MVQTRLVEVKAQRSSISIEAKPVVEGFVQGLRHPWILIYAGVLEPIPQGYGGLTVVLCIPLCIPGHPWSKAKGQEL